MLYIDGLSKMFGKFQALKNVSLSVPEGVTYALLGPNGSGKTTLLKTLIGSVPLDRGRVDLGGLTNVTGKAFRQKFVYMPQSPGFLPHLSARESIRLLVRLRGQGTTRGERLVEELKIEEFWRRPFGELSGGMKQKINILQCFMFDFDIAFLDEPTSSLDPQVASYVKHLIAELKAKGKTILFTSHIMSEVEAIADRMALISNGRILLETSPHEFMKEHGATDLEQAMLKYWSANNV